MFYALYMADITFQKIKKAISSKRSVLHVFRKHDPTYKRLSRVEFVLRWVDTIRSFCAGKKVKTGKHCLARSD